MEATLDQIEQTLTLVRRPVILREAGMTLFGFSVKLWSRDWGRESARSLDSLHCLKIREFLEESWSESVPILHSSSMESYRNKKLENFLRLTVDYFRFSSSSTWLSPPSSHSALLPGMNFRQFGQLGVLSMWEARHDSWKVCPHKSCVAKQLSNSPSLQRVHSKSWKDEAWMASSRLDLVSWEAERRIKAGVGGFWEIDIGD